MKKICLLMVSALLLTGCAAIPVMETVADEPVTAVAAPMKQIRVELPDEAAAPTMEGGDSRLYLCEDYEILIQTLQGGDLETTVKQLTGLEREDLALVRTQPDGYDRYDFVWVTEGERGQQLGRAVILDDGNYHYTMTVLRPSGDTEKTQIVWRTVFESFSLV